MNNKTIWNIIGRVVRIESILLLLPLITSIIYKENLSVIGFLITAVIAFVLGTILTCFTKTNNSIIYAREGFVIVALAWISMSVIGALPFVISGKIPSFIDALFETVSGFTTTGASVVKDVTLLGYGLNFWRCFTHWIGGMGILVFVVAFISKTSDRSIHVLRAEMPGPIIDKITPRSKDTAKIPYLIYSGLTVVLIVMLILGKMPIYDSIVTALATAGTGGFGIYGDSIASYSSYSQWVIAIFMLLFGVNFNLYFLIAIGKLKSVFKSTELKVYLLIFASATLIVLLNIYGTCQNFSEALRLSAFQVSSIMTTTGFSTADFNAWNEMAKSTLLILMLIGGSAGSSAGGLKVSRVILLFKKIGAEFKRIINPKRVSTIKLEGKRIDEASVSGVTSYFAIYVVLIIFIAFLLSIDGFSFETNLSASIACFNNIGPGFGAVGPLSTYADFSPFSKIILIIAMLLGRLEIYPLLIALAPSTWLKK